jgi:hypothetical protein
LLLRLLRDLFGGRKPAAPTESVEQLFQQALGVMQAGDHAAATRLCARMRGLPRGDDAADMIQAHLRFPGESYHAVIARIFEALEPRTYVEIGVADGSSLRLARAPTLAIGVDPQPQLAAPLEANQKVFAETSDAFFAGHDVRAVLGGLPVDLAFIDGMHHFEFALRDFANLERWSTPQSTILIHDVYPLDRTTQERARVRSFWSGDIWRLVLLLKKYRPELAVHTIATPPTGLAVVRRLDPSSRILFERHDQLRDEFLALDYGAIEGDMPGKLNLFPNDWARIRSLLA